jgi:hypothetical protein
VRELTRLVGVVVLASCAGPSLASLYRESQDAPAEFATPSELSAFELRRAERLHRVRERIESGLTDPQDMLFAAATLLDSHSFEDLELARDLALSASAAGDARGLPLAADAIDRALMLADRPQKFGTQYSFDPLAGEWSLYSWDPATTDEERRAMGVPTLSEALRRLDELNPD